MLCFIGYLKCISAPRAWVQSHRSAIKCERLAVCLCSMVVSRVLWHGFPQPLIHKSRIRIPNAVSVVVEYKTRHVPCQYLLAVAERILRPGGQDQIVITRATQTIHSDYVNGINKHRLITQYPYKFTCFQFEFAVSFLIVKSQIYMYLKFSDSYSTNNTSEMRI